ncbi:hypothetical protein D9M69_493970 [compost metagenome]
MRGVAQDVQGLGFVRQHGRQQRADHCIGVELIEGGVGFQHRHRQACRGELFQRAVSRVLLAAQIPRQAAVEADPEFGQVPTQNFSLTNTGRRQHVVVVCAEGSLAMSNQVDAAHVRVFPVR